VSNADTLQAVDGGTMKLNADRHQHDRWRSLGGLKSMLTWWTPSSRAVPSISTARWIRPATAPFDGAHIGQFGLLEVTGGTLTIDAASHLDNTGTVEAANGGTLIIERALSGKSRNCRAFGPRTWREFPTRTSRSRTARPARSRSIMRSRSREIFPASTTTRSISRHHIQQPYQGQLRGRRQWRDG